MLSAAPHRMMFFAGMLAATASGLWWGAELLGRALPPLAPPARVAPIWVHGWLMLYALLGPFIFGFLFTVFPRWMNGPTVPRGAYVAVFALLTTGLTAAILGAWTGAGAFTIGAALSCLGWLLAWIVLLRVLLLARDVVSQAITVLIALGTGCVAHCLFAYGMLTNDAAILHITLRVGLWGCLLPLVFSVCHRMLPFFTGAAVRGYEVHRPSWWLVTAVALFLARTALMVAGVFDWLWMADLPLAVLTLWTWFRWNPLVSRGIPLLWTLYVAFLWLPLGLLLQAAGDLSFALNDDWLVGRAPLHALGMGFLASLVLAMATRVTLGHSGRPLAMDPMTTSYFLLLQAAAVLRVASELVTMWRPGLFLPLLLAAALAWLSGLLPWAFRYGRIYLVPRIDGRPG